jgi:hypothetical protein
MTQVGLLTEVQKDALVGQTYAPDSYFYPLQDASDNWVISEQEINYCINPSFDWVKDLPLIEYFPKEIDIDI